MALSSQTFEGRLRIVSLPEKKNMYSHLRDSKFVVHSDQKVLHVNLPPAEKQGILIDVSPQLYPHLLVSCAFDNAMENDDPEKVLRLLSFVTYDTTCPIVNIIISWACQYGYHRIVEYILNHGLNEIKNDWINQAFQLACQGDKTGHLTCLRLLSPYVDIDTVICDIFRYARIDIIDNVLIPSVVQTSKFRGCLIRTIQMICQGPILYNQIGNSDDLDWSAHRQWIKKFRSVELICLLINLGFISDIKNIIKSQTAIIMVCACDQSEVLQKFYEMMPFIDIPDEAVQIAWKLGHIDILKFLLDQDIDVYGIIGKTPLGIEREFTPKLVASIPVKPILTKEEVDYIVSAIPNIENGKLVKETKHRVIVGDTYFDTMDPSIFYSIV